MASTHRLINNGKLNLLTSWFSRGLNVMEMDSKACYGQVQEWANRLRADKLDIYKVDETFPSLLHWKKDSVILLIDVY